MDFFDLVRVLSMRPKQQKFLRDTVLVRNVLKRAMSQFLPFHPVLLLNSHDDGTLSDLYRYRIQHRRFLYKRFSRKSKGN